MSVWDLIGRAELARREHQIDRAIDLYEDAARQAQAQGDAQACVHALRHRGEILSDRGRLDEAEPCLAAALDLAREGAVTTPLDLANTVRPLALLRVKQKHADALPLLVEARDLYAEVGIEDGVREMGRLAARLS